MSPKPNEIKEARQKAGLTQTQAGVLLHTTVRTWQQWEAGDRKMHTAFWELFCIKAAPQTKCAHCEHCQQPSDCPYLP